MVPLPPLRDGARALPISSFRQSMPSFDTRCPGLHLQPGASVVLGCVGELPGSRCPDFNPRTPCGGRLPRVPFCDNSAEFQSTRPVWGATAGPWTCPPRSRISIHAPRAGRDLCLWTRYAGLTSFQSTRPVWGATEQEHELREKAEISIHAPRVGRDALEPDGAVTQIRFQSTRPVWGATDGDVRDRLRECISIHAPRVGRDMPTA